MATRKTKTTAKPADAVNVDKANTAGVSLQILYETPSRAFKLLQGIGTTPAIRALMDGVGYSDEEQAHGWTLLHAASGSAPAAAPAVDHSVQDATRLLADWEPKAVRICRAALTRLHPAVGTYVLSGIAPTRKPDAVLQTANLLDRLDLLEKGKAPKIPAAAGHAAMATLAKRSITPEVRARQRALLRVAEGAGAKHAPSAEAPLPTAAASQKTLRELRAWFEDWSEMARAAVLRHDHLIKLGLAQRKVPKKKSKDEGTTDSGQVLR